MCHTNCCVLSSLCFIISFWIEVIIFFRVASLARLSPYQWSNPSGQMLIERYQITTKYNKWKPCAYFLSVLSTKNDGIYSIGDILPAICVCILYPDGCGFGSDSFCTYPCHCARGLTCEENTGECPGGCDGGNKNNTWWSGAWSGPGCQFGEL